MAEQPETRFKNRIKPLLLDLPNSYWIKIQQMGLCGHPDFVGCINGQMIAIELKKDKHEQPTPIQKWHLEKIAASGGLAFVVCPENWANTYSLLNDLACNNLDVASKH